jgi:lipid II:glycine glycyltransferase (peptidoglycan interpeptide bridge formation enzyme)
VLEVDDGAWDTFVAASPAPSHLQTTAWATIKRPNGWRAVRVVADGPAGPVGAQVLIQRVPGMPWGIGYAARGPVARGGLGDRDLVAFTDRLRRVARRRRLAYVRIEPEVEAGSLETALRDQGWRRAPHVQPESTRIIDLAREESAILAGMHRKCRQSIAKSERLGVRVVPGGASRLAEFYTIHARAMRHAGISPRAERTYRDMWRVLEPRGMARLLFAEAAETGDAIAALFLVACGPRAVDLYGGTTDEGGRLRANYLLKWEAIRRCREEGLREYDLWGLPRAGIAQFKSGFGGREVHYVGAWDLPVDRVGATVVSLAERGRARWRRWRYRAVHQPEAPHASATD